MNKAIEALPENLKPDARALRDATKDANGSGNERSESGADHGRSKGCEGRCKSGAQDANLNAFDAAGPMAGKPAAAQTGTPDGQSAQRKTAAEPPKPGTAPKQSLMTNNR